jgi:hypothetical protein
MDMVVHGENLSAGDQIANTFYEKNSRVCCLTVIYQGIFRQEGVPNVFALRYSIVVR